MDAVLDPVKNKGKSPEVTEGRPLNQPGTYKHRDTGAIYITAHGEEGVVQADALQSPVWQGAWERVGDVPSHAELLKQRKKQQDELEAEAKKAKAKKLTDEL